MSSGDQIKPSFGQLAGVLLWSTVVEIVAAALIAVNVSNLRGVGEPTPLEIGGAVVDGAIALAAAILSMIAWIVALFLRRLTRAKALMRWAGWLLAGAVLLFLVLRVLNR